MANGKRGRPALSEAEKLARVAERDAAVASGAMEAVKTKYAPRRSPLGIIRDAANSLIEAMERFPEAATARYEADSLEELGGLTVALGCAMTVLKPLHTGLIESLAGLRREADMEAEIASLRAQLEEAKEKLRVTGNGDNVIAARAGKSAKPRAQTAENAA